MGAICTERNSYAVLNHATAQPTSSSPSHNSRLNPLEQFVQLGRAFLLFFSSASEKTEQAFQKVVISKRDADGHLLTYTDPETKKKMTQVSYIEEKRTGDLYRSEEDDTIAQTTIVAVKCFLIAVVAPLYTAGTIAWHAGKIPLDVTSLIYRTFKNTAAKWEQNEVGEGAKVLLTGCFQLPVEVGAALFEVVKSPLFGIGVQLAGLYGIFKPFQGRKIEALIENAWQGGVSYRADFRRMPLEEGDGWLTVLQKRPVLYLGHCFQVKDNTRDPRIVVIRRSPIPL